MEKEILIAYASTHGSTEEVAKFIGVTMQANDFPVEVQKMRTVASLRDYAAVVVGAPLYMFHWHNDAFWFLNRYRNEFEKGLPLAIFAGGPIGEGDEKDWQVIRTHWATEIAKLPWLQPVSVQLIGGRFDPLKLRFPYSWIPAMKQIPAKDHRDWNGIRAWANLLAVKFRESAKEEVTK